MKKILVCFISLIYSKDEQIQNHWGRIWKCWKKLFHRDWNWKRCVDFCSSYWILHFQWSSQKSQKNEASCHISESCVCRWRLAILSSKIQQKMKTFRENMSVTKLVFLEVMTVLCFLVLRVVIDQIENEVAKNLIKMFEFSVTSIISFYFWQKVWEAKKDPLIETENRLSPKENTDE